MAHKTDHPHHKAPEAPPFRAAEDMPEPPPELGDAIMLSSAQTGAFLAALVAGQQPEEALAEAIDDPPPESTPAEPEPPPYWRPMPDAPRDRPIYTTADPERDQDGTLTCWRTTREKINGHKGWQPLAYWAAVLTRQRLGFDPAGWRESMVVREEGAA